MDKYHAIYSRKAENINLNLMEELEMYKEIPIKIPLRKKDFLIETPDYMYPDAGTGERFTRRNFNAITA